MTLIYGAVDQTDGFLVSDTLLVTDSKLNDMAECPSINSNCHILKLHLLRRDLAVGFSGKARPALNALKQLSEELVSDTNVPHRLLSIFREKIEAEKLSIDDCEFLILDTSMSGKLFQIQAGRVKQIERGYIGDDSAYRALQQARRSVTPSPWIFVQLPDGSHEKRQFAVSELYKEREEIRNSMVQVAQDASSETVGLLINHPVMVINKANSNALIYSQIIEAGLCPCEDRYDYSLMASEDEPYGVGIYYSQAGRGTLFVSGQVYPHVIEACDREYFKSEVTSRFGISLVP